MSSLDLLIVEGEVQLGVDVGGVILQRKIRGLLVKEREMDSGYDKTKELSTPIMENMII